MNGHGDRLDSALIGFRIVRWWKQVSFCKALVFQVAPMPFVLGKDH